MREIWKEIADSMAMQAYLIATGIMIILSLVFFFLTSPASPQIKEILPSETKKD